MAEMILGSAQGAVHSLLGRLTSVLVEEAQLLGAVRSDVQFIKDEMESMNGFLMHVAEATGDDDDGDHQVRAWMKQVAEVAYASQNSVDLYIQSLGVSMGSRDPGFLGYLRRLPKLVRMLPTRHRIATQIRELKVRSCEVGERRIRYDVRAPDRGNSHDLRPANGKSAPSWQAARGDDDAKEQEDARRRALADVDMSEGRRDAAVKWLSGEQGGGRHQPRVMVLTGAGDTGKTYVARSAYQDSIAVRSFDRKAWVSADGIIKKTKFLRNMLAQVADTAYQPDFDDKEEVLLEKLRLHLEGKRFLLVLDDVLDNSVWDFIKSALVNRWHCCPGSAILITTRHDSVAYSFHSASREEYYFSRLEFCVSIPGDSFVKNAVSLLDSNKKGVELQDISNILSKLDTPLSIWLFLRNLYVNPNQNKDDLRNLCHTLGFYYYSLRQVLEHVFSKLPRDCKKCLVYLSILPRKSTFARARLLRRWVAEDMITERGRFGALDQAGDYFDLLVAHGIVMPMEIGITGKVKNFTMTDSIHKALMEIAREENFSNANLHPDLAHRLSIRNGVQLQLDDNKMHATRSKSCCWNIRSHFKDSDQTNATEVFLESLSSSRTGLGLLEVLDLEDCKQLKDYHLKNICNHVFQLKYLSLRNTDITELPKQLDKLLYLETLDIRQTKVKAFARNSVFFRKIKHLLAGHQTDRRSQGNNNSEESFFTVQMPKHVGGLTELQVLSHIAVSGSGNELSCIGNLLRLHKLGVVLNGCDGAVFRHLYHTVGKLSKCLRSLSIRAIPPILSKENAGMDTEGLPLIPPKLLEKLEISGLENGLPPWIQKLGILSKITLHKTFLTTSDISILGKLASLSCLKLRQESCGGSTLTLKTEEFQSLKFLILECSNMSSINICQGASPKLKKIVWSSTGKQYLSGIEHLPRLQEIELVEDKFDHEKMKEEIAAHQNNPVLNISKSGLPTGIRTGPSPIDYQATKMANNLEHK